MVEGFGGRVVEIVSLAWGVFRFFPKIFGASFNWAAHRRTDHQAD